MNEGPVSAGCEIDIHLDLLDKQLVDRDGRLCGKVDDVELTETESGEMLVTALLVGPIALGPRFGGRMGRWLTTLSQRLGGDAERSPTRVDMIHVMKIKSAIGLDAPAASLGLGIGDDWVADKIIGRIPGAGHASE